MSEQEENKKETFNESCNSQKNKITRIGAIISFVCGMFLFPALYWYGMGDGILPHLYGLIIFVLGAYAGRRAVQDVSEKKYRG